MRILCAFISEQLLSGQVLDQALIEVLCSQEGDEVDGDRAEGSYLGAHSSKPLRPDRWLLPTRHIHDIARGLAHTFDAQQAVRCQVGQIACGCGF